MNIYFQISALIYTILTTIVFFVKKKVNTLENYIYRGILLVTVLEILADLLNIFVSLKFPYSIYAVITSKLFVCCSLTWVIVFAYYVYAITSPKNDGYVLSGDNKNFKHFVKALLISTIIILLLDLIIISLPVTTSYYRGYVIVGGIGLYFSYYCIAVCLGIIWYFILANKINIRQKKYTPVYVFNFLIMIGYAAQMLAPHISVNVTIAAFTTMVIYFTITNPDLQMIEELNIATRQAESANVAKTDFLSSMSHEIRTPLNAIIGFSQALAKEDISGSAKEEVKEILTASDSLLEIVNGILDISKIEAKKIEIVDNDYNTKKLLNEISLLVNTKIGSKVIEYKTDFDDNIPPVLCGDKIRLKQIITNLLTNAVKYTKEGSIIFGIKCKNQNGICELTITVKDSGIGMNKEDLNMLFTKFQRFDMDENINIQGTGLGMAITKGLVELMEGTIEVDSEYGKGTIFTVKINQKISDKDPTDLNEDEIITNITPFNASGQKVLVVDDNRINLKVAERLLREYKIQIELVSSGEECLSRIIDGKKYDLIFLDIMMPKMKGPEVLENLKNIIGFKTPVVALTADVISGMEEKYLSLGFDSCLPKPIVDEELYYILRKYLKENTSNLKEENKTEETKDKHDIKILEDNGINVQQGLELLKDMEMYELTMSEFYEELDQKLTDLNNYKNDEDMDNYSILAHSLKTEARYLGLNVLADMAYEHEIASKENKVDYITENYKKLKMEALKINDIIKKYLNK